MLILGIETSCDETSAAVVGDILADGWLVRTLNLHYYSENQNGDNRSDAAKSRDTERIVTVVTRELSCRHTRTDRHNEGYGHRAGGNSARIKCCWNKA